MIFLKPAIQFSGPRFSVLVTSSNPGHPFLQCEEFASDEYENDCFASTVETSTCFNWLPVCGDRMCNSAARPSLDGHSVVEAYRVEASLAFGGQLTWPAPLEPQICHQLSARSQMVLPAVLAAQSASQAYRTQMPWRVQCAPTVLAKF